MKQNFKSTLDSIYDDENKRMPLSVFYDKIDSPSSYYGDTLRESFIMSCNHKNGEFYERCKKYKMKVFDARNEDTGEKERCIGLLPRINK